MTDAFKGSTDICKDLIDLRFAGYLSEKSKDLLTLPEAERSGSDFYNVMAEFEKLEFFKSFSAPTDLLAKKLFFVARQGGELLQERVYTENPSQAMFFILNGVVLQWYETPGSEKCWPEKILKKGDIFGHVDIVGNRPPLVTAQTVGYSELLMLKKEDFHIVQDEMEQYCSKVERYLKTLQIIVQFRWTDEELEALQSYAKLCTYSDNQVIYCGDEDYKPMSSYFIVSGTCKIAREIVYSVSDMKVVVDEKDLDVDTKLKREVLEFEHVDVGYFFGVGEVFGRNKVIATSTVECLLIPRMLLVYKNKQLLRQMAKELTASVPTDQVILDRRVKHVSVGKKNLFKELHNEQKFKF